jgi:hypothetical protein
VDGVKYKFFKYPTSFGLKITAKLGKALASPLCSLLLSADKPENLDMEKILSGMDLEEQIPLIKQVIEEYVKDEKEGPINFEEYFMGAYSHALAVFGASLMGNLDFLPRIIQKLKPMGEKVGEAVTKSMTQSGNTASIPG